MKKIICEELINILEKDPQKHGARLNNIRNIGNPRLALIEVQAYYGENGALIIYQKMIHGGVSFYIENLSQTDYCYLKDLVDFYLDNTKYCAITSAYENAVTNKFFVDLFGKKQIEYSYQYGLFKEPSNIKNTGKYEIRLLNVNDKEQISNIQEDPRRYGISLQYIFDNYIFKKSYNDLVYGCFVNKTLIAYLHVNTFDKKYWDVGFIFTSEEYRGRGLATELIRHYAKDIWARGAFASYGEAINESSKCVAENVGFEKFNETYCAILKEQFF